MKIPLSSAESLSEKAGHLGLRMTLNNAVLLFGDARVGSASISIEFSV
jgi:hypothetical protein